MCSVEGKLQCENSKRRKNKAKEATPTKNDLRCGVAILIYIPFLGVIFIGILLARYIFGSNQVTI